MCFYKSDKLISEGIATLQHFFQQFPNTTTVTTEVQNKLIQIDSQVTDWFEVFLHHTSQEVQNAAPLNIKEVGLGNFGILFRRFHSEVTACECKIVCNLLFSQVNIWKVDTAEQRDSFDVVQTRFRQTVRKWVHMVIPRNQDIFSRELHSIREHLWSCHLCIMQSCATILAFSYPFLPYLELQRVLEFAAANKFEIIFQGLGMMGMVGSARFGCYCYCIIWGYRHGVPVTVPTDIACALHAHHFHWISMDGSCGLHSN